MVLEASVKQNHDLEKRGQEWIFKTQKWLYFYQYYGFLNYKICYIQTPTYLLKPKYFTKS
jgi:hypothetical protein